jgi:hypothetical protein
MAVLLGFWRWLIGHLYARTFPEPEQPPQVWPDRPGPYLPQPTVDVDFVALNGDTLGTSSAVLAVKIGASGILLVSSAPVGFVATQHCLLHGYSVWVGSDKFDAVLPRDYELQPGEGFGLDLMMPIVLGRDVGTNFYDPPPPDPDPPPIPGHKIWIATKTPMSS